MSPVSPAIKVSCRAKSSSSVSFSRRYTLKGVFFDGLLAGKLTSGSMGYQRYRSRASSDDGLLLDDSPHAGPTEVEASRILIDVPDPDASGAFLFAPLGVDDIVLGRNCTGKISGKFYVARLELQHEDDHIVDFEHMMMQVHYSRVTFSLRLSEILGRRALLFGFEFQDHIQLAYVSRHKLQVGALGGRARAVDHKQRYHSVSITYQFTRYEIARKGSAELNSAELEGIVSDRLARRCLRMLQRYSVYASQR